MSDDIGFSVACHKGDVPLLRGCLASIRYFAPDAPICLLIDGDFDSRPFEKRYGVSCIRKHDVLSENLKKLSFGYGITKMVALWEAPFKKVIHIDADAVLWGDIRNNLPEGDWDFVHNEPHEVITEFIQKTQYFDPQFVTNQIRNFDWEGNPYFNTGVFAFRVGALNLEEYTQLLEMRQTSIEKFGAGDQGVLNILVFRAMKDGRLKVKQAHLQSVVPVLSKSQMEQFRFQSGQPIPLSKATVVHWAGPKPYIGNSDVVSLPMDYFRELGMRDFGLPDWFSVKTAMRVDEFLHRNVPRTILNAKKSIKKFISRK